MVRFINISADKELVKLASLHSNMVRFIRFISKLDKKFRKCLHSNMVRFITEYFHER